MKDEARALRETLSANVKKHRDILGFTQEKLSEHTGISANMINDIEGCRTWVSDKTLVKLAAALRVETHRLFQPVSVTDDDIAKAALSDLVKELEKIRGGVNAEFEAAVKRGMRS